METLELADGLDEVALFCQEHNFSERDDVIVVLVGSSSAVSSPVERWQNFAPTIVTVPLVTLAGK